MYKASSLSHIPCHSPLCLQKVMWTAPSMREQEECDCWSRGQGTWDWHHAENQRWCDELMIFSLHIVVRKTSGWTGFTYEGSVKTHLPQEIWDRFEDLVESAEQDFCETRVSVQKSRWSGSLRQEYMTKLSLSLKHELRCETYKSRNKTSSTQEVNRVE